MKKLKLNLITLMHMVCEQKREIQDMTNYIRSQNKTIRDLRMEKEIYRRRCAELEGYADLCVPIKERLEMFKTGGMDI